MRSNVCACVGDGDVYVRVIFVERSIQLRNLQTKKFVLPCEWTLIVLASCKKEKRCAGCHRRPRFFERNSRSRSSY
jgi:hypothetical protein